MIKLFRSIRKRNLTIWDHIRTSLKMFWIITVYIILTVSPMVISAQVLDDRTPTETFVGEDGIWRWTATGMEVAVFGINYTVPFAHAYRAHKYLNIPHEQAIDADVYHFARLGFDAFRVHVWDCEISDTIGNLLENAHLNLFDYQINAMKDRGMKILITPIAYWGNGYPEPAEDTPGFSTKYGKDNCLTDPEAISAQENFLYQFVNHVNPYTGMAYKDDPDIVAFEISNEPHHEGTEEETRNFINRMVVAIQKSGCRKPVFYNVSHSIHLADAYYTADIQGGTFQWYPTGLVAGHEVNGNFLPNVAHYEIPFSNHPQFDKKTRIVYEYDAADIGRSYIHPYMAKSFREAGFQFVTQFSYDPMFMAFANTEYQTHFMNLAYAPQKALSLKIAGEVFRSLKLGETYGTYPADTIFNAFRVSYHNDLAEMVTETKFMYTNNTHTIPSYPEKLKHISGYGNSPVISYEGTGAYFLDKLEDQVWRLEVMPDAVWIRDPFERASLKKRVSVIKWNRWPMSISLPDLGSGFKIRGINVDNNYQITVNETTFEITPGVYLLTVKNKEHQWNGESQWNNIQLKEFIAPESNCDQIYVIHKPVEECSIGQSLEINATVLTPDDPEKVELIVYGFGWRPDRIEMERETGYQYKAIIPGDRVRFGYLRYYISVQENGIIKSFPPSVKGDPGDWDYYAQDPYITRVIDPESPVLLFDATDDGGRVYGNSWFMVEPSTTPGNDILAIRARNLGRPPHNIAARYFFKDKITGRRSDLKQFSRLHITGYSMTDSTCLLQVSIVLDDGTTYGKRISMQPGKYHYDIDLSELKKVETINLPNSFPTFLPFYSVGDFNQPFDISHAESIQFSIGPGIPEVEYDKSWGVAIERVFLK